MDTDKDSGWSCAGSTAIDITITSDVRRKTEMFNHFILGHRVPIWATTPRHWAFFAARVAQASGVPWRLCETRSRDEGEESNKMGRPRCTPQREDGSPEEMEFGQVSTLPQAFAIRRRQMDAPLLPQVEPDPEASPMPYPPPQRPPIRPVAFHQYLHPRSRRLLSLLGLCFLLLSGLSGIVHAQVDTNAFVWVQGGGGAINDKALGVAVDAQTNVIVVGEFSLTLTNGAITLTSAGSTDIFISKYNALGQLLWSKRFGAGLDDSAASVGVNTNGDIFVSGYYRGAVDFGGKPLAAHGGSTLDGFVAKLDRDGTVLWANSIGGSSDDRCSKVAVDTQGNVYAVGSFQGTVTLGPNISLVSTNAQSPEAFLIRYSPAGAPVWARRMGSTQGAAGYGLAIGPDGNPCVAGEFLGTASISGVTLPNYGDRDAFLVKFSAAGDRLWANHYGADGVDGATRHRV